MTLEEIEEIRNFKNKYEHKCECCGKEFRSATKRRRFCSSKCWKIYRSQAEETKEKTIHTKKCQYCGKEFSTTYSQKIYCSVNCRNSAINERRRLTRKDSQPSKSMNPLEGYQLQKCEKCGKTFYSKKPRRFCSQLCKINYKNAILNTAHFQKLYNELKDIDYLIRW